MVEQERLTVVCLPGMDGTGALFEAFMEAAPACMVCSGVGYAGDRAVGYEGLAGHAQGVMRRTEEVLDLLGTEKGGTRFWWWRSRFRGRWE